MIHEHIFTLARKAKCHSTKFKIVHTHLLPTECYRKKKKKEERKKEKEMWIAYSLNSSGHFSLFRLLMLFQQWLKDYQKKKPKQDFVLPNSNNFWLNKYIGDHISTIKYY